MKAILKTYNRRGKLINEEELTGFFTGPETEPQHQIQDPNNVCELYISLPIKRGDKGINKHVHIPLSNLFGEIQRKLNVAHSDF